MGYMKSVHEMVWFVTGEEREQLCGEADEPRVLTVVTIRRWGNR